jgi:hypothetical protein
MQNAFLVGIIDRNIKQHEKSDTIKEKLSKVQEMEKEHQILSIKKVMAEQIYKSFAKGLMALFILGIAMSSIGFTLWYKRRQKYEDIILKNEAAPNTKT